MEYFEQFLNLKVILVKLTLFYNNKTETNQNKQTAMHIAHFCSFDQTSHKPFKTERT